MKHPMLLCERRGLVYKVFMGKENHCSKFKGFIVQKAIMRYLNRKVSVSLRFCCRWYPQNVLKNVKIGSLLHFSPSHWRRKENCFWLLLTTYVTGKYELWSRSFHFVIFLNVKYWKKAKRLWITLNTIPNHAVHHYVSIKKNIFIIFKVGFIFITVSNRQNNEGDI